MKIRENFHVKGIFHHDKSMEWAIPERIQTRIWNFQRYQKNSMWNFQGLIKNKVEFPWVTKKK